MLYSREMLCCCEDARALQRRDYMENKVIRSFAARHTFLFAFKWSGRKNRTSVIAWALRATIDFVEPEYN